MKLSVFHKNSNVPVQAVMRVKSINGIVLEDTLFEDIISSEDNLISIDFLNGKSLTESGYSKVMKSADKYYLEFFDSFDYKNIMAYLENENSDFRVTSQDGVVVRPSYSDLKRFGYMSNNDSGPSMMISWKR